MPLYFMQLKVVTILFYPATIIGNLYEKIVLPVNVERRELKKRHFLCEAFSSTAFCRQVRQLCDTSTGKARCICAEGWKGSRCQLRIDEPQLDLPTKMPTSSRVGSACTLSSDCATDNSYCLEGQCQCQPGFTPRKGNCINVNECEERAINTCHRDALCIDTEGSYECNCKLGFSDTNPTLPGRQCQQTNECEIGSHNCDEATQVCLDHRPPKKWECVEQTAAPTPTFLPTPLPTSIPASPTSIPVNTPSTALPTFILTITSKAAEATNNPTIQLTPSAPINIPPAYATTLTPTDTPTTALPTLNPTIAPATTLPKNNPTDTTIITEPTSIPAIQPATAAPTNMSTANPTSVAPIIPPTDIPTTASPTLIPTKAPTTAFPTDNPTGTPPTTESTNSPTSQPTTAVPTNLPTANPTTVAPTFSPTDSPTTALPTLIPTGTPTTTEPTSIPTNNPTTAAPTNIPTVNPTTIPPTAAPTKFPTAPPTDLPTASPTASPTILPEITGAFEVSLSACFYNPNGNGLSWQRLFDFGNGPAKDNVLLTQWSNSNNLGFAVYKNGSYISVIAPNTIIKDEIANWKVGVDIDGLLWIDKNGKRLVQAAGVVPVNVIRVNKYIGKSNWPSDSPLQGFVSNFQLINK